MPLFVKDGAIIPLLSSANSADKKNPESLEIRHYGTTENTYYMYNDDGESYNYENGEFSLTELKEERKKNGELVGKSKPVNKSDFNYAQISWRWMTKE